MSDPTAAASPLHELATLSADTTPGNGPAPGVDLPRPFGRYTLTRQLGQGGMGAVFLATDGLLGRQVALKMPHGDAVNSPQALERFYREARAAAQLDHPGICRVLDVGTFEGQPYIVMSYVEGRPLADLMESYVGQPRAVAGLMRQIAAALGEAHGRGIVHRDLKPSNVMITERGEPVVMDFGLARVADRAGAEATSVGLIMGTPAYMAPEQASGQPEAIGPPTDVHALGVMLYELLAGRLPFQGGVMDLLTQVMSSTPAPPSHHRPDADPVLEAICLKAMAKNPADRFPGGAAMAAVLDDYLAGRVTGGLSLEPPTPEQAALEAALRELRWYGWEAGWPRARQGLADAALAPEAIRPLLAWVEGEDAAEGPAREAFADTPPFAALAAWVSAGRVNEALRDGRLDLALERVEQAMGVPRAGDPALAGQFGYLRAVTLSRLGRWDEAMRWAHDALTRLGREHFLTGWVLDRLGRINAGKGHFHAACEFYREAIACKRAHGDEPGLLASQESLGRVYIDWYLLDQAEEALNAGLRLAQKRRDQVAEARLIHFLGRVVQRRGEKAQGAGRKASAAKRFRQATDYFEWAVRVFQAHRMAEEEGRSRACLAVLALLGCDLTRAEDQCRQAEALVRTVAGPDGLAEVQRATARLRHAQGRHDDAQALLSQALASYEGRGKQIPAAETQLELARVLATAQVPQRMVVRAYQDAASRAEACRTDELVEIIDQELESLDEEAYWRHAYERVRSTAAPRLSGGLHRGTSEVVSMLCLELADFEAFCRGQDPEAVLRTVNQLLADFEEVLHRHGGHITSYLGAGLMAVVRETGHADRAVRAALELLARAADFNQPRGVLGLPPLPARIGVASGTAFLGNIGTYHYLCFTAVGPVPNLAYGIAQRATLDAPAISQQTYDQVPDRFVYRGDGPRAVDVAGTGTVRVWDVVGRNRPAKGPSSGRLATRQETRAGGT